MCVLQTFLHNKMKNIKANKKVEIKSGNIWIYALRFI